MRTTRCRAALPARPRAPRGWPRQRRPIWTEGARQMLVARPFDPAALKLHRFSCGEPELDEWLAKYAGQSERKDNVRTTLLLDEQQRRIAGYYSMRTFELAAVDATSGTGRSRRYPVPAMLIARLAVDSDYQGRGTGRLLLFDALRSSPQRQTTSGSRWWSFTPCTRTPRASTSSTVSSGSSTTSSASSSRRKIFARPSARPDRIDLCTYHVRTVEARDGTSTTCHATSRRRDAHRNRAVRTPQHARVT